MLSNQQVFKDAVTNTVGKFNFKGASTGKYSLTINSFGFDTYHISVDQIMQLPDIRLKLTVNNLNEVALSYTRPIIEQRAGKTIVNVAGNINVPRTYLYLQAVPSLNYDRQPLPIGYVN